MMSIENSAPKQTMIHYFWNARHIKVTYSHKSKTFQLTKQYKKLPQTTQVLCFLEVFPRLDDESLKTDT